jgi:hypothetical protein
VKADLSIEVRFRGLNVAMDLERPDPEVGMGAAIHVTHVEVDNEDEVAEHWSDSPDQDPLDCEWLYQNHLEELLEAATDQLQSDDDQGGYDG